MHTLLTHVTYDRWANLELLQAAAAVEPSAFTTVLGGSFPSLRDTFVHILWAESLWLERWQGQSFQSTLAPAAFPTPQSIREVLEHVHDRQLRFLSSLPPSGADRVVTYRNFRDQPWSYPLRHMVQHLIVHSAFHRGQAAGFLRQLGAPPRHTDFLVFLDTLDPTVA